MADGIPTDPPNSREIDFGALVRRALGDEYHKHEKVYQVGRGRTFESSDYGTQGIYWGATAIDYSGTAQDGGASFIVLGTDANGGADDYQSKLISAVDFATTTQTSRIVAYTPATYHGRVVPPWASSFVLHTGTAQGAGQAVMTLGTGAPSTLSGTLSITGGAGTWTGGTQAREILAYNGSTKVVGVSLWDAPYLSVGSQEDGAQATFYLDFPDLGSGEVGTTPAFSTVSPTFTRATVAWTKLSSGLWTQVASGTPRSFYTGFDTAVGTYAGYLSEGAGTQLVTPSASIRDMTEPAWSPVNMSSAFGSVGIDGTAGATQLTSAGGNSTILQTLTAAASTRTYSCWIKRVTGTGEIDITQDGGATWTDVTSQINASTYTRVSLSASVLNASFGIRIVTSGDQIAVDFNQFEAGAFATSPMASAGAARNADVLTYSTTGWLNASVGTTFVQFANGPDVAAQHVPMILHDGTLNNQVSNVFTNTSNTFSSFFRTAAVTQANLVMAGSPTANTSYKIATAWAANDFAASRDGGTVATDNSGTVATVTKLEVGNAPTAVFSVAGTVRRVAYFPQRLLNATLQTLTTNGLTFDPSTFPRALPGSTTTYRVEKAGPGVNTTYSITP